MRKRVKLEEVNGVIGKECTECSLWKTLTEYNYKSNGLGKRTSKCKECLRKYREVNKEKFSTKSKQYYQNNKEKIIKRIQEYYRENADKIKEYNKELRKTIDKDEMREYRRNYRREHLEQELERSRRHYYNNKEVYKANAKKYYEQNKDRFFLLNQKRRYFSSCLASDLTREELDMILNNFNNSCALTGSDDFHLDHVIPLSIGHGGTIFSNIIPLRGDLNASKSNTNIFKWFDENRYRFNLCEDKFNKLIEWLAEVNGVSVEDYRDYVYWCHENPHDIDDLIEVKNGEETE